MGIFTTRSSLPAQPTSGRPAHQRGVAAIEFALVFLLGVLPLLLLTFSGFLIFAAKQSLTLAASEGARAALHYGTIAQRQTFACQAAQQSMQWLLTFSNESSKVNCAVPQPPGTAYIPIAVSAAAPCASTPSVQCITVVTSFDYNNHPFLPGTTTVYGWLVKQALSSSATVQLDSQNS
ncbi:TadE/TadG family type IV pilus assembly protein [Dyella sp. 20L07]|uniref:TadE/TadG family type IV pilus assembly protein n=1 Tax=Dyella sp. 20L07 TaxID=3384240 RepID=UPI003D2D4CA0